MLCRGAVEGGMDIIEEGGSLGEAAKAVRRACLILFLLMSRGHAGFEDILEELRS